MATSERLLPGAASSSRFGVFGRCLGWRAEGTNRLAWKTVCAIVLTAEVSLWLCWIFQAGQTNNIGPPSFYALVAMWGFTICKMQVEIWGQDTPTWVCPGTVLMFFVIFVLIIPGFGLADAYCLMETDLPTLVEHCTGSEGAAYYGLPAVGVLLFAFGSSLSLSYEVSRFRWKAHAENKGKLHTVGLASLCIHPNYFGDLFTYTGVALACGTSCALSIPVGMLGSFVLIVVPNSDAYLAKRYPDEFPAYAARVGTLIPGVTGGGWGSVLLGVLSVGVSAWLSGQCSGACSGE